MKVKVDILWGSLCQGFFVKSSFNKKKKLRFIFWMKAQTNI